MTPTVNDTESPMHIDAIAELPGFKSKRTLYRWRDQYRIQPATHVEKEGSSRPTPLYYPSQFAGLDKREKQKPPVTLDGLAVTVKGQRVTPRYPTPDIPLSMSVTRPQMSAPPQLAVSPAVIDQMAKGMTEMGERFLEAMAELQKSLNKRGRQSVPISEKILLTEAEAAEYAGVTRDYITEMIQAKVLPVTVIGTRTYVHPRTKERSQRHVIRIPRTALARLGESPGRLRD